MAWTDACGLDDIDAEDLIRFDHGGGTYAIYHAPDGTFHATDGLCTHEKMTLCNGLVDRDTIECPKHNGRFNYRTGAALRAPVCVDLKRYAMRVVGGRVEIKLGQRHAQETNGCRFAGGKGQGSVDHAAAVHAGTSGGGRAGGN